MRPGSCIVDLAAEAGGNCELTQPGIETVREGVTIVGFTNLPSMMSFHASQLYSRNVLSLLQHLAPGGELALDFADEITAGACVAGKPEIAAAPETPAAPDPALDAPDASEEGSA
jgi:NAD(P) transhydrogenase subunit alpha